jgi:hypothetical protein
MPFRPNIAKEEMIQRLGITAGLPLFNQEKEIPKIQHPDWLWSGNGIKAEIYNKLKNKFAEDALEYLNALINLGGKATDHEVMDFLNDRDQWPLHTVSARRNYLLDAPFYIVQSFPGQEVMGPKGRPRTIWSINYKNLFTLLT